MSCCDVAAAAGGWRTEEGGPINGTSGSAGGSGAGASVHSKAIMTREQRAWLTNRCRQGGSEPRDSAAAEPSESVRWAGPWDSCGGGGAEFHHAESTRSPYISARISGWHRHEHEWVRSGQVGRMAARAALGGEGIMQRWDRSGSDAPLITTRLSHNSPITTHTQHTPLPHIHTSEHMRAIRRDWAVAGGETGAGTVVQPIRTASRNHQRRVRSFSTHHTWTMMEIFNDQ